MLQVSPYFNYCLINTGQWGCSVPPSALYSEPGRYVNARGCSLKWWRTGDELSNCLGAQALLSATRSSLVLLGFILVLSCFCTPSLKRGTGPAMMTLTFETITVLEHHSSSDTLRLLTSLGWCFIFWLTTWSLQCFWKKKLEKKKFLFSII